MVLVRYLLLLAGLVCAEPAFFCKNKADPNLQAYGDVTRYQQCGTTCECFAFELLCLTRSKTNSTSFTLESESFEKSEKCPVTECLCNTNTGWAKWSKPANGGESLPEPLLIELPTYGNLEKAAKSTSKDASVLYYKQLYKEFTSTRTRQDTIVNHQINNGKPAYLPAVITN